MKPKLLALLVLTGIVGTFTGCSGRVFHGTPVARAAPAADLQGMNWDGTWFRLSDQEGKVALVFFGYTNSTDRAMITLAQMQRLLAELGDQAKDVAVVFVTVDPQRDRPEQLAKLVPAFDGRIFGVSTEPEVLDKLLRDWGVIAKRYYVSEDDPSLGYTIDHPSQVIAVDTSGRVRYTYPFGTLVGDLRSDVSRLLAEAGNGRRR